jgi:CRISPR system Cascade subunit CasE
MTVYESLLVVNTGTDPDHARPGRQWVRNPYRVHQRLCMAFGEGDAAKEARILFHIRPWPRAVVFVRSTLAPDWNRAFENAAFLLEQPPEPARVCEYVFPAGARFRFSLLANPTIKRHFDERKNGQRVGVRGEADLVAWLAAKGRIGGFGIEAARVVEETLVQARKTKREAGGTELAQMTFHAAKFEGKLTVESSDVFSATMANGIGTARGFGFGYLAIGPNP